MKADDLRPGKILRGPIFPEPVQIIVSIPMGDAVNRDDTAYILDTFPIVKRKDEEKCHGDYRTQRVILEIYDALAASQRTGQPYATRLDPPPADPRCCHPPKKERP